MMSSGSQSFDSEIVEDFNRLRIDGNDSDYEVEENASSDAKIEERERAVELNAKHNANNSLMLKLPRDVLLYILKWVVSNDLDVVSLGQWSIVCKDFYSVSRDSDLWHSMCQKIWGEKVIRKPYSSWQSLFLSKPHIHIHGVYISRTSYVRSGDDSTFHYKPCLFVEYFRILRFFNNGEVMMLTTPQDPREVVHKLVNKNTKVQSLMLGRYVIEEGRDHNSNAIITASVRPYYIPKDIMRQQNARNRRGNRNTPEAINEYHLELELASTSSKRKFNKLVWVSYSCCTSYPELGRQNVCTYDVTRQFPALYFNRIKSFTAESNTPL